MCWRNFPQQFTISEPVRYCLRTVWSDGLPFNTSLGKRCGDVRREDRTAGEKPPEGALPQRSPEMRTQAVVKVGAIAASPIEGATQPQMTIPILLPCEGILGWLIYLAHACEMIQITLVVPENRLTLPKHVRLNQYANHVLYGLTCKVSPFLDLKANDASLAKRYSAPVTFGEIPATSYATFAHDVALEHVKVIEGYWSELHGGKITHFTSNPELQF